MTSRHLVGVALLMSLLAGCGDSALDVKGSDITNSSEFQIAAKAGERHLALIDHNGRSVTLASFKGKVVVLFFGYTHCPDVCPTTLSDMAQAMKLLRPEEEAKVQVIFASVDPERDTPEILKAYVPFFHPSFLGLYGTPEQVAQAAREFKIVYRKHVEPGASSYLVDHSAGSYVLDQTGRLRLYLPFAMPPADIAHDLSVLLRVV
jgi:protein SCO1/2